MTRPLGSLLGIAILLMAVTSFAQTGAREASIMTHPHFVSARAETPANRIPPFETPPSLACIYGLINDTPPAVKLEHEDKNAPKEQHWQVIRALVPLGK